MTEPSPGADDRGRLVLAGTTLGPESDGVLAAAVHLARALGGRLYSLHVLEPPPVPGGAIGFGLAAPALTAKAHAAQQEQLARVGVREGELAGFGAELGSPGPVLAAAADRLDAAVVVVAAKASSPLPLHAVGSTLRHLSREGNRPVFVVRGTPRLPPANVLAPVDLSPLAGRSLARGLGLLGIDRRGQAPVIVALYVIDERASAVAERAALDAFLAEHAAGSGISVRGEIERGDPAAQILAAGERLQPDLLLLGTHGRSGWQRLRLGSVAERVMAKAPTSILLLPPKAVPTAAATGQP